MFLLNQNKTFDCYQLHLRRQHDILLLVLIIRHLRDNCVSFYNYTQMIFALNLNMLWLCPDMIESIFFMQLQLTLTMFLLNILCILLLAGKCFTRKWRKFLPMFVFMLLEYGGLNHIMSLLLVL